MTETLQPDLCVVGAGAAGLSVAAIAASFGASVVLVEKGRMGGECLNTGCVPSKALIAAAEKAHLARISPRFGVRLGEPQIDFAAVHGHIRSAVEAIAPNDSRERYGALGVRVLADHARFVDRTTLAVGEVRIRPRRAVLATGSRPRLPDLPGLADVAYLTNETVFELTERPERLVVLGGGPIGVELAQAHRRLGAAVTILSVGPLLPREDRETAAIAVASLRADGVEIREHVTPTRVERTGSGVTVFARRGESAAEEAVEASHLLVAVGRAPIVDDLGLDVAGVKHSEKGIEVDTRLRTSNAQVFALGDCATGGTGDLRFTHAASQQAGIVVRNALFRVPGRLDIAALPRVTYCDPELAAVGLSEEEAFRRDARTRILRWPLAENDRAQAEGTTEGLMKAFVARDGRVLGCTIAAPHAGELLAPWVLAVAKKMKVQDLAGVVMPYPTYSELTKRTAVEYLKPLAGSRLVRGWLALARRFG